MMLALYVFAGYVASTVAVRAKFKDASPDTLNDLLQTLTLAAFAIMTWLVVTRLGGMSMWPNALPFMSIQVLAHVAFLMFKYIGGRKLVRRVDGFVTTLGTVAFAVAAMLIVLPKVRGRYVEIALGVCCGLPLLFALPSLAKQGDLDDTVLRAAEASKLVYSRGTSDAFQEVEFVHDKTTGARCGVYVDKGTIYVAFAGSDSSVDWVRTNFDVAAGPYSSSCGESNSAVVHVGFLKAWKSIEELVWEKVSNVMLRQGGSGRVVVCGHSLGGAVATFAGMDIFCKVEKKYTRSFSVITFAAPKVGNVAFRDMYDARIPTSTRVVTVYDPVPKININDFVHVKGERMLPGTAVGNPHAMDAYLKTLKAIRK